MKDPNNKEPKSKAQEPQVAISNNNSACMEALEKTRKEGKKRYLIEKRDKRKNLDSIPAIGINMTNLNSTNGSNRQNPNQIVCYNYNKKDHFAYN